MRKELTKTYLAIMYKKFRIGKMIVHGNSLTCYNTQIKIWIQDILYGLFKLVLVPFGIIYWCYQMIPRIHWCKETIEDIERQELEYKVGSKRAKELLEKHKFI